VQAVLKVKRAGLRETEKKAKLKNVFFCRLEICMSLESERLRRFPGGTYLE
jgi:hypothetical protein